MSHWWIGHIFGMGAVFWSLLDATFVHDIITGMPDSARYFLWFFAGVYSVFQALRINQRYISDKLDNQRKVIDNKTKQLEYEEKLLKFNNPVK